MPNQDWSRNAPTESGWHWWRSQNKENVFPVLVRIGVECPQIAAEVGEWWSERIQEPPDAA